MKELVTLRSPSLQNLSGEGLPHLSHTGPAPTHRFRVVILGPSRSGKTSLVERFFGRECPIRHRPTVEEMHEADVFVHGIKVTLELLDTSGTYEFPAMRRLAYDKGDAFLLVCSLEDADPLEDIRLIRQELIERRGKEVPTLVVANKVDLIPELRRRVAETVVRMDWEHPYVECSALTDKEVTPAFSQLLVDLVRLHDDLYGTASTAQESTKKKNTRGISLPQANVRAIKPKTKAPLKKRHSCAIS